MITNIENKLKFIELINKMNEIKRAIILQNWEKESDAEHSFHLAIMVCVFLPDFPELSELKTIKIALFHDLVKYLLEIQLYLTKKWLKQKNKEKQKLF